MSEKVFQEACLRFLNVPYIWGGDDPMKGLDCSGLVQELLAIIGLDPIGDQTAQALRDHLKTVGTERPFILGHTGELVFFGKSTKEITHVGMIISGNIMIEAGGGGSKTVDLNSAISQNAFVRLRPVGRRKDLVSAITPNGLPWLK